MLTASLGDGSIVKEGLPPSLTTTLDPWRKEKTEGILWFPQATMVLHGQIEINVIPFSTALM